MPTTQPTPLSVAAPGADAEQREQDLTFHYVRRLQRDGRLLLRHISGRGDRAVPPGALEALFEDTAAVAGNPKRIEALATCVDALSRAAAPATAATIRLTRAYLRGTTSDPRGTKPDDDDEIGAATMGRGRQLRLTMLALAVTAFALVLVALALLAHVDDGRRAQQQLQSARAELRGAYEELARMPPSAWVPEAAGGEAAQQELAALCGDARRKPANTPEGLRANGLCNLATEAGIRLEMAQHLVERWNCRHQTPWRWVFFRCPEVPQPPPSEAAAPSKLAWDWNRTEIRADPAIATLKGFVLPLLMGFLGGAAYVLRRFGHKLSESTLEPQDGWHAVLRVLLASMLGGLLGAVWSGNEALTVGGVDLSLAAAAFFVGFALEAVFSLIEAMVASVSGRIRGEEAPPPPR